MVRGRTGEGAAKAVRINTGAVKPQAGSVSTKVNKSDDALVCFCLVCVNLLSLFEKDICRKKCLYPVGKWVIANANIC